ncbi:hypothetical protein Lal_00041416 [Lupinus albus]|uniref:Putative pectinesterase n=1 Tax=Lupinus albus TaxID=3870 RepID=A0A6A4P7B5_LUPAL|nr:putative pectinesterase [Lupinus albus]KAF1873976.1 hypothetical protein Lal_00041416 [Lupinus albus]
MVTIKLGLSVLFLNLVLYIPATSEFAVSKRSNPSEFIKSSCKSTLYPTICVHCLIGYANSIRQSKQWLAITALNVSLSWTRSCASFVKKKININGIKPREYRAMQDCIENMDSSVDSLQKSARELNLMGDNAISENFDWHMSNVQTWVSAALTYQSTCLDSFAGPKMNGNLKDTIRGRVIIVSQVTSNALALVNRFASRHQTTTLNKKP